MGKGHHLVVVEYYENGGQAVARLAIGSELSSLDPPVLDILRLGVYQLREMGSVPEYAAVSQSVELAKEAGIPSPGMVR